MPLINKYVPLKPNNRKNKVPWSVNPPRVLQRAKSLAWTNYKSQRSISGRGCQLTRSAWVDFQRANDDIRSYAISSQMEYEKKITDQIDTNPKLFHSYIRHRRVGQPSLGPLRLDDGRVVDDPGQMAQCFVQKFASVFITDSPTNPSPNQVFHGSLSEITITPAIIDEVLSNLDPNSSMGSDGIHPRLLKCLSSVLSIPLSIIFNSTLIEETLPVEWVTSLVVPIYKSSSRLNPLNYRPISLTSVPCKVMERIIVKELNAYLCDNDLISVHQFGFRQSHSTADQLLLTYDYVTEQVDGGQVVDIIFFDFAKAFDRVSHSILIGKLRDIGIGRPLLDWIEYFLTSRTMSVRVASKVSRAVPVLSGVPQGSCLGPVLFIIYINHVANQISCSYKIFADDIKLYFSFHRSDINSSVSSMQRDIDKLVSTGASWGLNMNSSKCVCLRFAPRSVQTMSTGPSPYKISGVPINYVTSCRDLGVTVDNSLKFHSHISKKVGLVSGLSTNFLSSTLCREQNFLINIYKSLIRPQLEYCSSLWNLGYRKTG